MEKHTISVVYLDEKCELIKGTSGAFAFDVIARIEEPILVKKGEMVSIPLGIKVDTHDANVGVFLLIRSGLAFKHGLMVVNSVGLIDSDFRGEIQAGIYNTGRVADYEIQPYERIGQICFMQAVDVSLDNVSNLSETARADGGFGESGRFKEDISMCS